MQHNASCDEFLLHYEIFTNMICKINILQRAELVEYNHASCIKKHTRNLPCVS